MNELLGSRFISELARRGERGSYLSYEAYQELTNISSAYELGRFLADQGYETVRASDDVISVANGLREAKEYETVPSWAATDILGAFCFPFWALYRCVKGKPSFPTCDRPATDHNGRILK